LQKPYRRQKRIRKRRRKKGKKKGSSSSSSSSIRRILSELSFSVAIVVVTGDCIIRRMQP
jgi:hypothetical protein